MLLGLPAAALAGECVPLDAVLGADGTRIRERVGAVEGLSQRLAALLGLLEGRLAIAPRDGDRLSTGACPDVAAAWDLLTDADQAHLTRDRHRFAGASPTVWLQGESLPFVQDDGGAGGAGSTA